MGRMRGACDVRSAVWSVCVGRAVYGVLCGACACGVRCKECCMEHVRGRAM